jgi:hypothetical protein
MDEDELCYIGTWDEAPREAEEADRLAEKSGQWQERAFTLATRAILEAHRGDVAATRALVREGETPVGRASSPVSTIARFELRATLRFLELSLGDPAEADLILGPLAGDVAAAGIAEPGVFRFHANAVEVHDRGAPLARGVCFHDRGARAPSEGPELAARTYWGCGPGGIRPGSSPSSTASPRPGA